MNEMAQYEVVFTGRTPLIMHSDNITFTETVDAWRKAPENKKQTVKGDDRSPAWTWIGYLYHDGRHVCMPSDNLMTLFRESGKKVILKKQETFKKITQSNIVLDQPSWEFLVNGKAVPIKPLETLIGNNDFTTHLEAAKELGFELLVKRAKIGQSKHIRVRPLFRNWICRGTLTVIQPDLCMLNEETLQTILSQGGAFVGMCDWRPSSPSAGGSYGLFESQVNRID